MSTPEGLKPAEEPNKLKVSLAKDMDVVDLARRTGGILSWRGDDPYVEWKRPNGPSLDWRQYPEEKDKTMYFWRGEWGGSGMEYAGLVIGEKFAAFVRPDFDNEKNLHAEVIIEGKVKNYSGPVEMFAPEFLQARDLCIAAAKERNLSQNF